MCIHAFHRTDSTDTDIYVLTGEYWRQKHTQHEPSMKTECDYLYDWNTTSHIRKKSLSLSLSHTHTHTHTNGKLQSYSWECRSRRRSPDRDKPILQQWWESLLGVNPCWVGVLAGRVCMLTLTPLLCLFVCL